VSAGAADEGESDHRKGDGVADGAASTEVEHAGVLRTLKDTPSAVRIVLVGAFLNQFGAFLQFFVVLYLLQRGFTAQQAGIALGAYSIGAIGGTLFGGTLSDRVGPRTTMVLGLATASVFTLSVTVLDNFVAIVVVVALSGAMTRAASPAVSALVFEMTPPARQVMVFAMYRTAINTGAVAGPLVAVWLSTVSWNLVFYFDAATALGYAAIAAIFLPRGRTAAGADAAKAEAQTGAHRPKTSYLTVLRDRRYAVYLALMLANGLVHVQFFAVLPLQLREAGYPTWAYGTLGAASALTVISTELFVTRTTQRWKAAAAVMSGWLLLVVGYSMFGLPGGLVVLFAGALLAAFGQVIGGPAAFAWPAKVAPPGATGRYLGSMHAVFGLGYAVGPIVGIALWSGIGNWFWALILAFGLAMVPPGVWSLRPPAQPGRGGADAEPDTEPDAKTDARTDVETDPKTEARTDAVADGGTDAKRAADRAAESGAGTETHTAAPSTG
jgi:MFS family permease